MSKALFKHLAWLTIVAAFGMMTLACNNAATVSVPTLSSTETTGASTIYYYSGSGTATITHNLGSSTKDVFFILTNSQSSTLSGAQVASSNFVGVTEHVTKDTTGVSYSITGSESSTTKEQEISNFNRYSSVLFSKSSESTILFNTMKSPSAPLLDTAGDIQAFYDDATSSTINATCRKVVTDISTEKGTKTLNIWVADNCYTGGTKSKLVTDTMLDEMADKFLKGGMNNDIYDWVTTVFGAEWGSHSYSNLITDSSQITILLYDIDNDDTNYRDNGGIVGYFWSKDNFTTSSVPYSNERIMFYIDAVMFADDADNYDGSDEGTWSVADPWPATVISTLSHEFQHMINYYQKSVLQGEASELWLNELCSMNAEDLLSSLAEFNGPRGVDYSDGSAGSELNTDGRLPLFNYWDEGNLLGWYSNQSVLISYSLNYSFGAFLGRNYGGAQFFNSILSTTGGGVNVIQSVTGESLTTLMRNWGAAVLLSDRTDTTEPYRFNSGGWILDSMGYNLGSINMYNYLYNTQEGPYLYSMNKTISTMRPTSNTYINGGTGISGEYSWVITVPEGIIMTMVVKPSE